MKKQDHNSAVQEHPGTATIAVPKIVSTSDYQYKETINLVQLVRDAADLISAKGENAFDEFRRRGSRWLGEETYIFVLDLDGNMLVHPDPALEGRNQLELKDINGKPIIRGLIGAATTFPEKPEGWFHYQWVVPGDLLPRWKSSFVQLVNTPSGNNYIVGSGMYNDRMERAFVVDAVKNAVMEINKNGKDAFSILRDPAGPYVIKNNYVFVTDTNGVELVNAGFPNLEGRNLLDVKDTNGKYLNKEMLKLIKTTGSGWSDYMWPKPGDSVSTLKSSYVHKANIDDETFMVGCGAYLAEAPREVKPVTKMKAHELMTLVRDAADILHEKGEEAYAEFRKVGSRWFRDETYLFVFNMEGTRAFHAAEPETEGKNDHDLRDILGKPFVKMILETGTGPYGEGWVHYMYPEPGNIFPVWKSSFVKHVAYPSGKEYIVGCGIYNMQMERAFVEDVVNQATALVEELGKEAFSIIRDKKGPFIFMDTYVFVLSPDGTELVNPAQPMLEGRNLIDMKDLSGREIFREEIALAMTDGSGWLDLKWWKPGDNVPALKHAYVKKAQYNGDTFIVGSGLYEVEGEKKITEGEIQKISWRKIKEEKFMGKLSRQAVHGEKGTLSKLSIKKDDSVGRHYHENEEYGCLVSGSLKYHFDDREIVLHKGEVIIIPGNLPHSITGLEDSVAFVFFTPRREDWIKGEDSYLR